MKVKFFKNFRISIVHYILHPISYIFCCLLLLINTVFATVTASIDRNPIALGDTVNLTVTSDNGSSGTPDFSALNQQFTVVATSNSTEITVVNGKQTLLLSWTLSLHPSQQGTLTIPAFKIGNEYTKPISLTVAPPGKTHGKTNDPVFLEASIAPKTAYTGTTVTYSLKLYYAINGLSGQLIPPTMNNISFKQIGKDSNYQVRRNGKYYMVLERNFAFSPDQAGQLKIPGATFDGTIPIPNPQTLQAQLLAMSGDGQSIHLTAPDVTLTVKALPADVSFAAQQVNLTSKWSGAPDNMQIGQPITRTLTLQATGQSGNQLPAISESNPSQVNAYPDQPQVSTTTAYDSVIGTRQEKIAYIPQQSGTINFPAIQIKWLNTKTGQVETASLPAEHYTIKAGATNPIAAIVPASATSIVPEHIVTPDTKPMPNYWLWIAIAIGMIWIITLILWWYSRRIPKASIDKVVAARQNVRQAIQDACQQNNAKHLQKAVLTWAHQKWPHQELHNLSDIANLDIAPALRTELQKLNTSLYKDKTQHYNGSKFWLAFLEQESYRPTTAMQDKEQLPPLYPD